LGDGAGSHRHVASTPSSILEGSLDALDELPRWLEREGQAHPDGAAIGFISYELARHLEAVQLPSNPALPDVSFAFYPHLKQLEFESSPPAAPEIPLSITSSVTYPEFKIAVEKIRASIAAGDIYQANLTIPFSADLGTLSPESIYARLRRSNSPFRAFLKTPGRTILSDSPERFFRVSGDRILTSPIKGTIARSPQGREDDGALLLASEKDRAENLMIVDLLRNDLGRICDYSSIHARLWEKEVLPHLVHLVSHVEGTLRPGTGIRDIVQALFPCGSITGAPKIRAMEILAGIEQAPRGISMGAIGIIRSPSSPERVKMDFSVAIRTMVIQDGRATFNVGGGIVYDSEAAAEYSEVMLKARPLFAALGAKNIDAA
jgi:para-aminobenzoate synthetase component 1